ncbi:hypothetical protein J502_3323 [Acinetobacter sp. 1294596]|nr:hypothetical protein J579_2260 [Acinetobacter sp. 1239920]EXF55590.1 hypothetical protein J502_3323 [Acinetobacter sp. 1294596]
MPYNVFKISGINIFSSEILSEHFKSSFYILPAYLLVKIFKFY